MPCWIVGPAIVLVFFVLVMLFLKPLGQLLMTQFGDIGGGFPLIILAVIAVLAVLGLHRLLDLM